jgi:hypothetical protein
MVVGQLWQSAGDNLELALGNLSTKMVTIAVALRVDGHSHLRAGSVALVDGVESVVDAGDTHLRMIRTSQRNFGGSGVAFGGYSSA